MKKLLTLILALMLHATAQAQVLPDDHWIFTHQWYSQIGNDPCGPVVSNPNKIVNRSDVCALFLSIIHREWSCPNHPIQ